MKKVFFVCTTGIIMMCSCNSDGDSSTTVSDTTTTAMDTSTSTSPNNAGSTSGNMGTGADTTTTGAGNMTNSNNNNMDVDAATSAFITKAASGGMMEIELGNIAKQNAKSQRVKDFAEMIVTDHTTAANELKRTAPGNMSISSDMLPEHRHHVDMMKNKTGADFDKAYIDMMVTDHKKDINEYKKASTSLKNDAIKGYATKTLPVLQKHLDSAQAIDRKM